MSKEKFFMKTFEEFSKLFEKARQFSKLDKDSFDNVVKKYYEKYKNDRFNEWLSQFSVEEVNKAGLDVYRKIFEAMDEDYFKSLINH